MREKVSAVAARRPRLQQNSAIFVSGSHAWKRNPPGATVPDQQQYIVNGR